MMPSSKDGGSDTGRKELTNFINIMDDNRKEIYDSTGRPSAKFRGEQELKKPVVLINIDDL